MNDLRYGQLSPTGEFIQCGSYAHYSVAQELVESAGLKINSWDRDKTGRDPDAEDILFAHGYVLIGISELDHNYRINYSYYHTLTPEQRQFLEPYFDTPYINKWDRDRWERER